MTRTLPDGRALGYASYGPAEGTPLFFFHGTPGARTVLPAHDPSLEEHGVRIIAPDRPGYGLSTADRGRTILSWADDVRHLADSLGVDRFAVAGASGGGPYALACAYAMPDRVTGAALVCSAAPLRDLRDLSRMTAFNRLKFGIPRLLPALLWLDLAVSAPLLRRFPDQMARRVAQLSPTDRSALASPDRHERLAALIREAFRTGSHGLYSDLVLGSRDWGFEPSAIRLPVRCWHGEEDRMAPVWMIQRLVASIPGAELTLVPRAGHLILQHPDVWPAVLAWTVAQSRPRAASGQGA